MEIAKKPLLLTILTILICIILAASIMIPASQHDPEQDYHSMPDVDPPQNNQPPQSVITTINTIQPPSIYKITDTDAYAYPGSTITLDASNSNDVDGKIIGYKWILPDNTQDTAPIITFTTPDEEGVPVPLSIVLELTDDSHNTNHTTYTLTVIPNAYDLYTAPSQLHTTQQTTETQTTKTRFRELTDTNQHHYPLLIPQPLTKGTCVYTIAITKPLFSFLNKISLTLYDPEGIPINSTTQRVPSIPWTKKTISITVDIEETTTLGSLSLTYYGYTLRDSIILLHDSSTSGILTITSDIVG